jgi:UDP:flavonoid glycosyltransferase YjiC (YdhE family)
MRVLMVTAPGAGHVFPLVPLAWALRSGGHDVLLASMDVGVTLGSAAGLLTADVAPGMDMQRILHSIGAVGAFDGSPSRDRRAEAVTLFAEVNRVMLDGTRRLAHAWRPDVIVYGSLEPAGAIVAAELGVPGVEHAISPAAATGVITGRIWSRLLDSDPVDPVAAIGIVPESLAPAPSPGWAMRAVPYNGGAAVPDALLEPAERPRVLITMGTVAPRVGGGVDVVRALVDELAGEPVDVLVALGIDPTEIGTLPPSVRAFAWLPLTAALPHCAAVVHHGGSGTMLSALAFGVPQIVVPQGADQFMNAAMVARRGCGLDPGPRPSDVRDAVRRAVTGEFDATAAEVRAEIEALPTPRDVADGLVDMLTTR